MKAMAVRQLSPAWKIVPAFFLQTCTVMGIIKSTGVFFPELRVSLGSTKADLGLAVGLFDAFVFGPGPLVVYFYRHGTINFKRPLIILGAVLATCSYTLGAFAFNKAQFAVCLSLAGLGLNFLSLSLVLTLQDQCDDRLFGVLYGIGKSGYAFGMALVPLLADYLMELYGWRAAMMILGGIFSHLVPLAMLVRPDTEIPYQRLCPDDQERAVSNNKKVDDIDMEKLQEGQGPRTSPPDCLPASTRRACKSTTGMLSVAWQNLYEIFRTSIFNQDRCLIAFTAACGIYAMVDGGWHAFLLPHAIDRHVSISRALGLSYAAATANFIGRCFGGFLSGKLLSSQNWFALLTLLNCTSILADVFIPTYAVMVASAFISSLSIGGRNILFVIICKERAPRSAFTVLFAAQEIVFGVGALMGTYIAGILADISGNFSASFLFLTALDCLVLLIIVLFIRCSKPGEIDKTQE